MSDLFVALLLVLSIIIIPFLLGLREVRRKPRSPILTTLSTVPLLSAPPPIHSAQGSPSLGQKGNPACFPHSHLLPSGGLPDHSLVGGVSAGHHGLWTGHRSGVLREDSREQPGAEVRGDGRSGIPQLSPFPGNVDAHGHPLKASSP